MRMGFGFNVVPAVNTMPMKNEPIQQAIFAYIDNICINKNVASMACVKQQFADWKTILECSVCKSGRSRTCFTGSTEVKYQRCLKF